MDYLAIKNKIGMDTLNLNAIFSTIYAPIVPRRRVGSIFFYNKNQDNFEVYPSEKGAIIRGEVSQNLIKKLSEFDVFLKKIK